MRSSAAARLRLLRPLPSGFGGQMARPFCNKEQRWAKLHGCKFIGVVETEAMGEITKPPHT